MNVKTDVTVQLSGRDGNVFSIIERVRRALVKAGWEDEADEFVSAAVEQPSYEAVLALVERTVTVA